MEEQALMEATEVLEDKERGLHFWVRYWQFTKKCKPPKKHVTSRRAVLIPKEFAYIVEKAERTGATLRIRYKHPPRFAQTVAHAVEAIEIV